MVASRLSLFSLRQPIHEPCYQIGFSDFDSRDIYVQGLIGLFLSKCSKSCKSRLVFVIITPSHNHVISCIVAPWASVSPCPDIGYFGGAMPQALLPLSSAFGTVSGSQLTRGIPVHVLGSSAVRRSICLTRTPRRWRFSGLDRHIYRCLSGNHQS